MKKTIGIIGGMGPAATVDLLNKIIENTDAIKDQDYPHIIADFYCEIPDRTEAILNGGESPVPYLIESAKKLEKSGANFLIIACHTAHFYIDEIRKSVDIPILSMVEETAKYLINNGCYRAIILGTSGSKKAKIYLDVFSSFGIDCYYPSSFLQCEIMDIIYKGIKANKTKWDSKSFNEQLALLEKEYKATSVLACTELPIAVDKYGLIGNFLDPTLILAKISIVKSGCSVKQIKDKTNK